MVVGGPPERWVVGRPLAGTPTQKIGSASALARFLLIFSKQRRERRSRHLAVVGTVVGHLRDIRLPDTGRAAGLLGGGRRVGGLFEALARILLASLGPHGLFYSIGGSTATLGPNGLFFAGSRGSASLSSGAGLGGPPVGFDVGVLGGPEVGGDVGRP